LFRQLGRCNGKSVAGSLVLEAGRIKAQRLGYMISVDACDWLAESGDNRVNLVCQIVVCVEFEGVGVLEQLACSVTALSRRIRCTILKIFVNDLNNTFLSAI